MHIHSLKRHSARKQSLPSSGQNPSKWQTIWHGSFHSICISLNPTKFKILPTTGILLINSRLTFNTPYT